MGKFYHFFELPVDFHSAHGIGTIRPVIGFGIHLLVEEPLVVGFVPQVDIVAYILVHRLARLQMLAHMRAQGQALVDKQGQGQALVDKQGQVRVLVDKQGQV